MLPFWLDEDSDQTQTCAVKKGIFRFLPWNPFTPVPTGGKGVSKMRRRKVPENKRNPRP